MNATEIMFGECLFQQSHKSFLQGLIEVIKQPVVQLIALQIRNVLFIFLSSRYYCEVVITYDAFLTDTQICVCDEVSRSPAPHNQSLTSNSL